MSDRSNQPPSLLALIDEALSSADDDLLEQVVGRMAAHAGRDTPEQAARREKLMAYVALWEHGGQFEGREVPARPEILTQDHAMAAADLAGRLKKCRKTEDDIRMGRKRLFDGASKAVQSAFLARIEPLDRGAEAITRRLNSWQRRLEAQERARIEAERAAAAEAAAARGADEAPPPPPAAPEKARVRGAGGSVATTRSTKHIVVDDLSLVPREYLLLNEPLALSALKSGIKIPGLSLGTETATVVRG